VTEVAVAADFVPAGERDAAASELFAAHYPRLAGWCRGLVDDDDTAHEIAAEAFTRLLARWSGVEDPRGYLYVVAANLVRDHWRRRQRERRAFARVGVRADVGVVAAADPALRVLVEALPDRMRLPVLLHYYADLPISRIADLLGRPEGTVKSDLHDARARLMAALEGQR
jgi:RNA polymerase sigma-70 factor (ECF subfamily)